MFSYRWTGFSSLVLARYVLISWLSAPLDATEQGRPIRDGHIGNPPSSGSIPRRRPLCSGAAERTAYMHSSQTRPPRRSRSATPPKSERQAYTQNPATSRRTFPCFRSCAADVTAEDLKQLLCWIWDQCIGRPVRAEQRTSGFHSFHSGYATGGLRTA